MSLKNNLWELSHTSKLIFYDSWVENVLNGNMPPDTYMLFFSDTYMLLTLFV